MAKARDRMSEQEKDWFACTLASVFLAWKEMEWTPSWGEVFDNNAPEGYDNFKREAMNLLEEIEDAL